MPNPAKPNGLAAMNACLVSLQINRLSEREARFLLFLHRKALAGRVRVPLKWVAQELGEEDEGFYQTRHVAGELKEKGLVNLTQQKEAREGEARRNFRAMKTWLTKKGEGVLEDLGKIVEMDAKEIMGTEGK